MTVGARMTNMRTLAITILCVIALFPNVVRGETLDTTTNLTQRPSIKFSDALSIGTKALDDEAKSYACAIAESKTSSSGGGWDLQFRSRTLPSRWIRIDKSGKVISNPDSLAQVAPANALPRVTIEKAFEVAVATRDKPEKWHAVLANWNEERDEWFLVLVNSHRDAVHFRVDSNGKAREQKR